MHSPSSRSSSGNDKNEPQSTAPRPASAPIYRQTNLQQARVLRVPEAFTGPAGALTRRVRGAVRAVVTRLHGRERGLHGDARSAPFLGETYPEIKDGVRACRLSTVMIEQTWPWAYSPALRESSGRKNGCGEALHRSEVARQTARSKDTCHMYHKQQSEENLWCPCPKLQQ